MLFETDVIEAVYMWLEEAGYKITQKLYTTETGDDIIAVKGNRRIVIEAKGETSSKEWTKRYGKPFSPNQVHKHVCAAFYKACEVLSRKSDGTELIVGIAFPDNKPHRDYVENILPVLLKLGIVIFWVDRDLKISTTSSKEFTL